MKALRDTVAFIAVLFFVALLFGAFGCAAPAKGAHEPAVRTCVEGLHSRPCGTKDPEMQSAVRALRSCQYARQCGPHGQYLACYAEVRALCARRSQPPGCWQDEAIAFEPFGDAGWMGWHGSGCL